MSAHISTSYRKHITWNNYPADVMKSGLQKYIRRSILDKALYCAAELDLFKEAPNAKEAEGIRTNFLHRLMIIFMEDVENLALFDTIYTKMNQLFQEREKADRNKDKELYWVTEVVTLLVRSKKARICSHVRALFNPKYQPLHDRYPSMNSLWLPAQKNTLEHNCSMFKKYLKEKNILAVYYAFQIEASEEKLPQKLFRSSQPVWFIFHQLMNPLQLVKTERVQKFVEWYKEHIGGMKEGFMCWLLPLLHELDIIPSGTADAVAIPSYVARNREGHKIEVDEYVLDKHTSRGRGKGLVEFALVGALVEPQAEFVNPLWKQFYEDGKRYEEGVALRPILGKSEAEAPSASSSLSVLPSVMPAITRKTTALSPSEEKTETDAYDFLVRTQLTTMGTKMDVYFAKTRQGQLVVVKGPYATRAEIDVLERNTAWKRQHGLPYNNFIVRHLIPNRWPEGVPLGARNKVARSRPAYFLVFDSYLQESDLRTMMHSSTLWPATEVIDWKQIPFHFTHKARALTEQEYIDYIHAVLFRYLLGVSDFADRNFIMKDGRVISIDEDVEGRDIDMYTTLQKNKAAFLHEWLQNNYERLGVSQWVITNENQREKLIEIQNKARCLALFRPRE
jgi:hypothetical protein